MQATEVLKLALGIGSPLYGQLMIYDALDASFQTVKLPKQPECMVCGTAPTITTLVDSKRFCADEELIVLDASEKISPKELAELLEQPNPPVLVDVRTPIEHQVSVIKGAISIPLEQLSSRLDELDSQQETIVFCRTGRRSARAVQLLHNAGFAQVKNLVGGINAWVEQIRPDMFQY